MIHLLFALKVEALALINLYQLKKIKHLPFTLYKNEYISILITQLGLEMAEKNTLAYLQYTEINPSDTLINIGICAAPNKYAIEEIILVDKLSYKDVQINLTPIKHKEYKTAALISFMQEQEQTQETCADMEAFAIISSALKYFNKEQLYIIKIVSDHYEPQSITKESVQDMMYKNRNKFQQIIEESSCQQQ